MCIICTCIYKHTFSHKKTHFPHKNDSCTHSILWSYIQFHFLVHTYAHVKLSVYMYTGDNDTDSVASGRLIAVTKNYCHLTYRAHPRLIHTLLASVLLALSLSGCGILFDSLVRAAWFRFMTILQPLPKHVSQNNFTMLHVTRSRIADYNALYLHQTHSFISNTNI